MKNKFKYCGLVQSTLLVLRIYLEITSAIFRSTESHTMVQLQPNTFVGLNTGRPKRLRPDTLKSLNKRGKDFKVEFQVNYCI